MTTQQLPGPLVPGLTAPTPPASGPATPATASARASTRKPKTPTWQAKPQVSAVIALVLVLILALAVGLLGWVWALVGLGALIAVGFWAAQAWRRKGKGGLFDGLLRRSGRSGSSRTGLAGRAGGRGGGLWPGLGGRRARTQAGPGGSSDRKGALFAGLRSRLPRALGGSPSARKRPGSSGSGLRGSRPGSTSASARKTGSRLGGSSGASGRKSWPFRTRKQTGSSGSGSTSGSWLPGGSGSRGASGRKSGGRSGSSSASGWKPLLPWSRKKKAGSSGSAGTNPDGKGGCLKIDEPKKTTSPSAKTDTKGDGSKPSPEGPQPKHRAADQKQPTAKPQPLPGGATSAAGNNSGGTMKFSHDQSLQRAGANLGSAEEAAAEVKRLYALAEGAAAKFNALFGQATDQMVDDMPAAARLKAEMEATRQQAARASSVDEWRAVVGQAATLPKVYSREHEVDEARLAGGRGGRHRERRADVTTAEQDN